MAPKKEVPVVETKVEDTSPWGAFINFSVPSALLELVVPPPAAPEPPPPVKAGKGAPPPPPEPEKAPEAATPKVHFSITYSSTFLPVAWEPVEPSSPVREAWKDGDLSLPITFTFQHNMQRRFRFDETHAALEKLINSKVLLQLHESSSGNMLAAVQIDMLPFAMGKGSFDVENVQLQPLEQTNDKLPKLIQGSIPKISVSLTSRIKSKEAAAQEGQEAAEASGEPAEKPLPEPQPFRYISEEDAADGANVIELRLEPVSLVPPGLKAAVDAVGGKDGFAGKVSFTAAVPLPAPGPLLSLHGRLQEGQVVFSASEFGGVTRFLVTADAAESLRTHLEGGRTLSLELARYVQNDAFLDNGWDAYHAGALLPGSEVLLEEGQLELSLGSVALATWDKSAASCLPGYVAPGAKLKNLEPDAAVAQPAWESCGGALGGLSIKFVNPIVPVWSAPPEPKQKIPDLIPTRDLHPAPPPATAADDFQGKVQEALMGLARAYQAHPKPDPQTLPPNASLLQKHQGLIFELNHSGAYVDMRESFKEALQRLVRDELKASGRMAPVEMGPLYGKLYTRLMDLMHMQMSSAADTRPKPPPRQDLSESASLRLLQLATEYESLGRWLRCSSTPGDAERVALLIARAEALHQRRLVNPDLAQSWLDHAEFCVRTGDLTRALESVGKALEIDPKHSPSLLLLATASLNQLIQGSGSKDQVKALVEKTLVAGWALLEVSPEGSKGLAWALLSLVYANDPSLPGATRKNLPWASCRQMLSKLERSSLVEGRPTKEANPFLQLWTEAQKFELRELSEQARDSMPRLQRSSQALGYETSVGSARMLLQADQLSEAAPVTRRLARAAAALASASASAAAAAAASAGAVAGGEVEGGAGGGEAAAAEQGISGEEERRGVLEEEQEGLPEASKPDLLPATMQAEVAWRQGRLDEFIRLTQALLAMMPSLAECPLQVHLQLAEAYVRVGEPRYAVDHLAAAAAASEEDSNASGSSAATSPPHRSSPLLWLLAGRACVACGALREADVMLTEANLLDPELPEPWGLLALLAAKDGRWADAGKALARGKQVGLRDAEVLGLVAAELEAAGRWEEAAEALEWAVSAGVASGSDVFELHCRLIQAHVVLGNAARAGSLIDLAASSVLLTGMLGDGTSRGGPEGDTVRTVLLNEMALRVEALPIAEAVGER